MVNYMQILAYENEFGGHIRSHDLELGQISVILPEGSNCLSFCKVWLKYIAWLQRYVHFSLIAYIHVK